MVHRRGNTSALFQATKVVLSRPTASHLLVQISYIVIHGRLRVFIHKLSIFPKIAPLLAALFQFVDYSKTALEYKFITFNVIYYWFPSCLIKFSNIMIPFLDKNKRFRGFHISHNTSHSRAYLDPLVASKYCLERCQHRLRKPSQLSLTCVGCHLDDMSVCQPKNKYTVRRFAYFMAATKQTTFIGYQYLVMGVFELLLVCIKTTN